MEFSELISSGQKAPDGGVSFHIPEGWMQGRTTYGGLTSALCLKAALPLAGEHRPIRSAQIAFVGPVNGNVTCHATLLREGKNTVFASVRMTGEGGIAAEAIFTFGAHRTSSINFARLTAPEVSAPEETTPYFEGDRRPAFTRQFNMRLAKGARPMAGADEADLSIWMRHKDTNTQIDSVSLLALADAPPPAAMSMLTGPVRASSMTWMAEFLTDDIQTDDGWFLARHIAETSKDGYSSQSMTLWNSRKQPVMIGRQTIAIFE